MEWNIRVNGASRRIPEGCTVAQLLELMGIDATRVALERNRQVVPRATYATAALHDGDRIEVVTFVGGG